MRRGTKFDLSRTRLWIAFGCLVLVAPAAVAEEASVHPGINAAYGEAGRDVEEWVRVFEGESREVFAARRAIVAALGLEPGMAVADVGSGTGLFVPLLAAQVGATGHVFAVDVAPRFAAYVRDRVAEAGLEQVTVVLSRERSVSLAPASIDLAFLCDVYHHLEYPRSVLASIARALRPGGWLVIVDFEREPGRSPPWILEHVRADRATVAREIAAAGFVPAPGPDVPGLEDNYLLRFTRP